MADIKTRDIVKGTVKTLDRSAVATERMKSATVRTKNAAEQSVNGNEVSAQEYGANRVESAVEIATAEGVRQFNKQGKNGFRTEIDDNKCVSQFIKKDDLILMESVCKIGIEADVYYLVVYSDFTEIQKQCGLFWNSYGIVVFIISVISGLLILASAKKITKPLSLLTKVSDEVALGNYGKKVDVKSSDYEITALSESFNSMSLAIEQKIKEIREESEKRNIFVADFTHEMKTPMTAIISSTKTTHSKRDSKDIWVNLLRCSCGSSFRKNKWHTKNDGGISYGYQCYNQLNNGNKKKREELGLDTEGFCDSRMIADWKLDFMAKSLLEHLWTDRKESVLLALDLIKRYYRDERVTSGKGDTTVIQAKLNKATSRLKNLIAMRADGEITKDEYQAMRSPVDAEIRDLQRALEEVPKAEGHGNGLDLDGITATLHSLVDFSEPTLNHDVINKFVYQVTPTSDTSFHWYINLNGNTKARAVYTVEGRKKKNVIKLEEIEEISSLHRKENEDATILIQTPLVFALLHRQQLKTAGTKQKPSNIKGFQALNC